MKKTKFIFAAVIFCISAIGLIGCNTIEKSTDGLACGVRLTGQGIAQDSKGLFGALVKADNWIKENLW
ncbi:MAG: hypothetical protein HZC15_00605 [Candidatus Omnitrophica bacterium]|nr:hypothetical protein [Candidatus Omnitrophota bacterium]